MATCYRYLISQHFQQILTCQRQNCLTVLSLRYNLISSKNFSCLQAPFLGQKHYMKKVTKYGNLMPQSQIELIGLHLKSRHRNISYKKAKENSPKFVNKKASSDSDFMTTIYASNSDGDKDKSRGISRDDYFKKAWLSEIDGNKKYQTVHKEDNFEESDRAISYQEVSQSLPENTFGTLEGVKASNRGWRKHNDRVEEDDKDDNDRDWRLNIPLSKYGRKNKPTHAYHKEMFQLSQEGKIKEAIAVFDKWMLIEDRVRPTKRTFITLISILGRIGYTRKAFQLFRQMKNFGLDPTDHIYTSLFHSCANCPMPDYGLNRAHNLYLHMKDMGITPTLITVKASMKAFAICGDFAKAFQILDETNLPLDSQCFDALLMACISDKEAGFKRAAQVLMLMRDRNIKPEESTYNLLARCVRDCGIGNPQSFASDLGLNSGKHHESQTEVAMLSAKGDADILNGDPYSAELQGIQIEFLPLQHHRDLSRADLPAQANSLHNKCNANFSLTPSVNWEKCDTNESKELLEDQANSITPAFESKTFIPDSRNFISEQNQPADEQLVNVAQDSLETARNGNISCTFSAPKLPSVRISDLKTCSGRLALLGGHEHFISHMIENGVQPSVKTFTLLLSSVPNNTESELAILTLMENVGVPPDIDCLNDVMMRRNMRHESDTVKDILPIISRMRLIPNMRTYAALALTCHNWKDGIHLINDMKEANLEPTVEVMGHLIYISRADFKYKQYLLTVMEDLCIKPNIRIIKMIEKSIANTKQTIVIAEKRGDTSDRYLSPRFQNNLGNFLRFYRPWLKRTELDRQRHPWDGLEETSNEENDKKADSDRL